VHEAGRAGRGVGDEVDAAEVELAGDEGLDVLEELLVGFNAVT
jgi:hypothetical protein